MDDRRKNKEGTVNHEFSVQVQIIEKRKLRSKSRGRKHIWFGLGMFGMVGGPWLSLPSWEYFWVFGSISVTPAAIPGP